MSPSFGPWLRILGSGAIATLGIAVLWSSWPEGSRTAAAPRSGPWTVPVQAGWLPDPLVLDPWAEPQPALIENHPAPHDPAPVLPPPSDVTFIYVVKQNDSLWGISARVLGDPLRVSEIERWNPGIGERMLQPGMEVVLPGAGSSNTQTQARTTPQEIRHHLVSKGENLTRIANRYGVTAEMIFEGNRDRLPSIDRVRVGQRLRIPEGGGR